MSPAEADPGAELDAWKWLVRYHLNRADAAEAEVERLTRECLDREATETNARERLRQVEERLAAVEAELAKYRANPLWRARVQPDPPDFVLPWNDDQP